MTLKGIDVSKWQAATPSVTGLSFLFARATIGTEPDVRYKRHIAAARMAGLVTGAYHFNWSPLPIESQVNAFLAAAGDVHLLALDVETQTEKRKANGQIIRPYVRRFTQAQARAFIKGVKAADPLHRKVGLYMSDSGFYLTAGQDFNWIANYSYRPSKDWSFWQYRGDPGDLDKFAGTPADLAKMAGTPTAPDTSIPEDGMKLVDVKAEPGTVTINAAGPVWRVADDVQVDVNAGATWACVGTARYHQEPADPTGDPGYMIRANAADGELHIVSTSRCTFVPAPVTNPAA
jgi:hypothetical protein